MPVRRMLPFIVINIVVSSVVVLALLFWWDRRQGEDVEATFESTVVALMPAPSVTAAETRATEPATQEEDGPTTHVVRPGDTLGSISRQYDVPLEDIMLANGIDNPDFLQVNQELVIPIGGVPTATTPATPTADPATAPSPIPTQLLLEGEAEVSIAEAIGVGSLADEAVSIVNAGSRPIALLGWRLQDENGRVYTFGQVTLFGEGAAILVHTEAGQDGPSDLYWGLEQPVWDPGETITLFDSEGTTRATFLIDDLQ